MSRIVGLNGHPLAVEAPPAPILAPGEAPTNIGVGMDERGTALIIQQAGSPQPMVIHMPPQQAQAFAMAVLKQVVQFELAREARLRAMQQESGGAVV